MARTNAGAFMPIPDTEEVDFHPSQPKVEKVGGRGFDWPLSWESGKHSSSSFHSKHSKRKLAALPPSHSTAPVSAQEANAIAKSWLDTTIPWYFTLLATTLLYILVLLIAFVVSYRPKYNSIIPEVSYQDLTKDGTQTVNFPIFVIAADTSSNTTLALKSNSTTLKIVQGSPANPKIVPGSEGCVKPYTEERLGSYDVATLNLTAAGPACRISDPSMYLALSIPYTPPTSSNPFAIPDAEPCLLVGLYPWSDDADTIKEKIGDVETSSSLRFVPGQARAYLSVRHTTLEKMDGKKSVEYETTIDWIPQPSSASAPGTYGTASTTEQPVLNVYIKYASLISTATKQKRQMSLSDIFFAAIGLWAGPDALITALAFGATWWLQRKKAREAGI
ncbi:hypothetical protein BT69DRAFT_1277802 [Atractiella rhizophila]|nr:hypothetical protein BT69DRAFT_1277802 [Atractiella rhizophila]